VNPESVETRNPSEKSDKAVRGRILHAAMEAFTDRGYAQTSTLEIATRAKVSKRELYALFGNKEAMLAACVAERAGRMRLSPELSPARDRKALAGILTEFGKIVLREICQPAVLALFRLAISEAKRSPEVARILDTAGRQAGRDALRNILARAQSGRLVPSGALTEMVGQFFALLWEDLMLSLLLCVRKAPGPKEVDRRAKDATLTFLRLYTKPDSQPLLHASD
jgi:AcrR family transcriptional regulator